MNDYPRVVIGFGQTITDDETDLGTVRVSGDVEPISDACPACGTPRENRYHRVED